MVTDRETRLKMYLHIKYAGYIYAIFHAVRSILALDGIDRKKHSGAVSCFQQNYVNGGVFDKKYSGIVQDTFEAGQGSDYEDFYVISKGEAFIQLENTKEFIYVVKQYIENII